MRKEISGKEQINLCEGRNKAGDSCQARRVGGLRFCFFHAPALAMKRTAARKRGGRNSRPTMPETKPAELSIESASDTIRLVGETINQLRRREIDPKRATAIGYLTGVMLKALDFSELEERLARLESALVERDATPTEARS